ncbi:ABC transporter ATP-binding protein [Metabacillus indicus]|uniref:ABC transporter ATP-binding protein n=1 Tax=Metabacillus indicus TaxID=246786 RepID=UPI00068A00C9|nr:ABC transporter ATP-binding protein [Metabacillus indicus]
MARMFNRLITFKEMFLIEDIKRTFALLGPYLIKYKASYFALFTITILQIFLTLGFAWFFGTMTDAAVQNRMELFKWLIPSGIGLLTASLTLSYYYTILESKTINIIKLELKDKVLTHILHMSPSKMNSMRTGDLMTHFTNDIQSTEGVIGSNLLYLLQLPLTFIAVTVYMFQINWQMSLIGFAVIPAAIFVGGFFGILLRNNSRTMFHQISSINSSLHDIFQGMPVIRSFLLEKKMAHKQHQSNRALYHLEMKNAKLRGLFYIGGEAITSITYVTGLCLGAYFVSKSMMTVGSLLTFVTLMQHLISPLTGLAGTWGNFQSSATAVERLSAVLSELLESHDTVLEQSRFSGAIMLKDICFAYEREEVIKDFSLNIQAGKTVAIVGPSGAGKTTLFQLIQGFYEPQGGEILLDDIPFCKLNKSEIRQAFSFVAQETFLFSGTIRDNLLLGRSGITEQEMIEAANTANIHEFIMSLPDRYETEVGERGVRLSGGQKQRLSIARAILKNASILLLDEATSALDTESEEYIKQALLAMPNKTTLIIAHRLSTIQHADLIVVMEKGKIVQSGTHQELSSIPGMYKRLLGTQNAVEEYPLARQIIS